ncbi:MAG: decarboxylating 6-phosphogluconate dehydrogenase [Candidatus Micrarchaeota archaeon]|nr:decarboxylating 6-phosphogluconate dehydrogenase [Candidatus Micrarchaeota archaeon]
MVVKEIGIIGLGKMGRNIALNLLKHNYRVVAHNRSKEPLEEVLKSGAEEAASFSDFGTKLGRKRTVWIMLPAGDVTDNAFRELADVLESGDIIIDGSNSMYKDSARRAAMMKEKGISVLDAGCSGGPSGALNGMSIMAGGERSAFDECEQLFKDLSVKNGYLYTGESGSGHFVKMIHNAIEYGMMESIAEGFELMHNGPYKGIDLAKTARLWNNGSVIRGYLIELTERGLGSDRELAGYNPEVEDKGEGRYAVTTAVEYGVPFGAITESLYVRFSSRDGYKFGNRLLSAMRHGFGGHEAAKK